MRSLGIGTRILVVAVIVASLTACGNDGPTEPETRLSSQEAQAVAVALFEEVSNALDNVGLSANLSPARAGRVSGAHLSAMPTESISSNCANGGRIIGTFTYNDNTNSNGTGSVSGSISITPQSCRVSTGSRLIAVNGSLQYTFGMTFVNYDQASDFTFRGSGAITWAGGSCSMDYTLRLSMSGTISMNGTICGESINATL